MKPQNLFCDFVLVGWERDSVVFVFKAKESFFTYHLYLGKGQSLGFYEDFSSRMTHKEVSGGFLVDAVPASSTFCTWPTLCSH